METFINTKGPVLIVDDDENILNLLTVILSKIGFRDIRRASDGQKALVKVLGITPRLIITDIDMPVMNGLQFVYQIRKKSRYMGVPILALTARDTKEIVLKAMSAGVDTYLIKGIITEQLMLEKIKEADQRRLMK